MDAKLMEVLKNPCQFYDSLYGKQKRSFQKLIFPEGLRYSMKKTRISNLRDAPPVRHNRLLYRVLGVQ